MTGADETLADRLAAAADDARAAAREINEARAGLRAEMRDARDLLRQFSETAVTERLDATVRPAIDAMAAELREVHTATMDVMHARQGELTRMYEAMSEHLVTLREQVDKAVGLAIAVSPVKGRADVPALKR